MCDCAIKEDAGSLVVWQQHRHQTVLFLHNWVSIHTRTHVPCWLVTTISLHLSVKTWIWFDQGRAHYNHSMFSVLLGRPTEYFGASFCDYLLFGCACETEERDREKEFIQWARSSHDLFLLWCVFVCKDNRRYPHRAHASSIHVCVCVCGITHNAVSVLHAKICARFVLVSVFEALGSFAPIQSLLSALSGCHRPRVCLFVCIHSISGWCRRRSYSDFCTTVPVLFPTAPSFRRVGRRGGVFRPYLANPSLMGVSGWAVSYSI